MTDALCTICIPAYQAADFIARTLDCAQAQTERAIAIHVSVDLCDDATADICETRAQGDPRIKVWRQRERLGWSQNANFLIQSVQTPYYCLYFHDDLIADTYVSRLCGLLQERPDATTAHSDMAHFGATDHVANGAPYEGGAFERMFQFLDGKHQPPLLRSVTRTAMIRAADLVVPPSRAGAVGAHHVYVLGLLASGASLYAREVLYRRHNQRVGGLTESWRQLTIDQIRDAFYDNADAILRLRVGDDPQAPALLTLTAYLFVLTRLRLAELERGLLEPTPSVDLSQEFKGFSPLAAIATVGGAIQERALRAYALLLTLEADQCARRRDFDGALARYCAAAVADAGEGAAVARIAAVARKATQRKQHLEAIIADGLVSTKAAERVSILQNSGLPL